MKSPIRSKPPGDRRPGTPNQWMLSQNDDWKSIENFSQTRKTQRSADDGRNRGTSHPRPVEEVGAPHLPSIIMETPKRRKSQEKSNEECGWPPSLLQGRRNRNRKINTTNLFADTSDLSTHNRFFIDKAIKPWMT